MLSQENIDKLHMNSLYQCKPVLAWLPLYKRDNPYHCKNWTFRVQKYQDDYYMHDAYWSTGDDHPIKLTDDNIDKFTLLFDYCDVIKVFFDDWIEYPENDRWCVADNSGGINYPHYYVRKGAHKIKEKVIERLKHQIEIAENELKTAQYKLERAMNDDSGYYEGA